MGLCERGLLNTLYYVDFIDIIGPTSDQLMVYNKLNFQLVSKHKRYGTWPRLRLPVVGSTSSSPVESTAILGVPYTYHDNKPSDQQ